VTEFLTKIQQTSKKVLLVTNAHRNSLDLKMEKTCLHVFLMTLSVRMIWFCERKS